jgi:hypothetical protein
MIPTKKEIVLNNYMKDILESHPVKNLKDILRKMKQEVGSYSKMKKAELIDRIMELKKKGFPVPKVEKYVKPDRKKPEPKKPEPKKTTQTDLEKKKFFDHYKFKVGDEVVVPRRNWLIFKIESIEPKYLRMKSIGERSKAAPKSLLKETPPTGGVTKLMYYTQANKLIGKYTGAIENVNNPNFKEFEGKAQFPYLANKPPPQDQKVIEQKKEAKETKPDQALYKASDFSKQTAGEADELNDIINDPKYLKNDTDFSNAINKNKNKKDEIEKLVKEVANSTKEETLKKLEKHFKFHKEDLSKMKKGDILVKYLKGKLLYNYFFQPKSFYEAIAKKKENRFLIKKYIDEVKYFRDLSNL